MTGVDVWSGGALEVEEGSQEVAREEANGEEAVALGVLESVVVTTIVVGA